MKWAINLIMVFVIVCLISCERDPKQPGYQVNMLTDMVYPVPYESYGKMMQKPVPGTIYRGGLVYKNQVQDTKQALLRGRDIYGNYCLVCHGKNGDGDGPLIPKFPNPPSLTSRRVKALTSDQLYKVIIDGKGDMPSHAGQIEPVDRWKLVYYVEQLQGKR